MYHAMFVVISADKHSVTMYLPARHITLIVFEKNPRIINVTGNPTYGRGWNYQLFFKSVPENGNKGEITWIHWSWCQDCTCLYKQLISQIHLVVKEDNNTNFIWVKARVYGV